MPNVPMNIQEIEKCLPHRYPMLLVDRITEIEPMTRCVGIKNVTMNEWFFTGHYPGMPIMPGVLILESMAQTGAFMLLYDGGYADRVPVIGSFENVKFRRKVVPGDQLVSTITLLKFKSGVGRIAGQATVDGELAASMEMTFMFVPKE